MIIQLKRDHYVKNIFQIIGTMKIKNIYIFGTLKIMTIKQSAKFCTGTSIHSENISCL